MEVMMYILVALVLLLVLMVAYLVLRQPGGAQEPMRKLQQGMDSLDKELRQLQQDNRSELERNRDKLDDGLRMNREELQRTLLELQKDARESQSKQLEDFRQAFTDNVRTLTERMREQTGKQDTLRETMISQLEIMRDKVTEGIKNLQENNEKKLDQMRATVDEKLQSTLETRLNEKFQLVSKRLEEVHRGLGEMQTLASGVGDLKKVLTNVKNRGILGEIQLASLLEQLLTPEQFAREQEIEPGSGRRVEFAVKLPGRDAHERPIWLPIDAKFPTEDYQRLLDAYEQGDGELIKLQQKQLLARIKAQAKDIQQKYIAPPYSTDFAIMFLPVEGLYAEVLRMPGLFEQIQREHKVTITGPTTLSALLNSLQMGFRTLALEKRSSEVWEVLSSVKTEFGKFNEVIRKVKEKLELATKQLDTNVATRSRAMQRALRNVEALPEGEVSQLLNPSLEEEDEEDPEQAELELDD